MAKKLMTKNAFAKLSGRSRQAISKATKKGGPLAPAMSGKKINASHQAAKDYLKKSEIDKKNETPPAPKKKTAKKKAAKKKTTPPRQKGPDSKKSAGAAGLYIDPEKILNGEIDELQDLTLKEIATRYGGVPGFKGYIDALRGIADYQNKAIKAKQKRAELVDRVVVEAIAFGLLDLAFKRLVNEMPGSLSQQIIATVKSAKKKKNVAFKVEEIIRQAASRIIKDCKTEIKSRIKRHKVD